MLLLRHFEAAGVIRQAISVVKKRSGSHERAIREMRLDAGGVRVGEPLTAFQGILTGHPTFTGGRQELLQQRETGQDRDLTQ